MDSMKSIDFVIRDDAGSLRKGQVPGGRAGHVVPLRPGQKLSMNLRTGDLTRLRRQATDMHIVLRDGRAITLDQFFDRKDLRGCLFVSSDGALHEVHAARTDTGDQIARGTYPSEMRAIATDAQGQSNIAVQAVVIEHNAQRIAIFVAPEQAAQDGIELGGQVEPGMTITANFQGQSFMGVVDDDGNWTMSVPAEAIAPGVYEAEIAVTATTPEGEAQTLTERLNVDTENPQGAVISTQAEADVETERV